MPRDDLSTAGVQEHRRKRRRQAAQIGLSSSHFFRRCLQVVQPPFVLSRGRKLILEQPRSPALRVDHYLSNIRGSIAIAIGDFAPGVLVRLSIACLAVKSQD